MTTLYLSLGHNSSCVASDRDYDVLVGYEEERLTKVKSDSSFPRLAITECLKHVTTPVNQIFVSSWFDNFEPSITTKYWDAEFFKSHPCIMNTVEIQWTNDQFTHHDAHAWSADAFYGDHVEKRSNKVLTVVVDGFGTDQEVASAYYNGHLVNRINGYENSMGLIYQHCAEACGMDGINDVYKFLGYRTFVYKWEKGTDFEFLIDRTMQLFAKQWFQQRVDSPIRAQAGNTINGREFQLVRQRNMRLFDFYNTHGRGNPNSTTTTRNHIGYLVQEILERTVINHIKMLVDRYNETDTILLTGGCFYNVRLNDYIRRAFPEKNICVMPLAGDQGAAIGMGHAFGEWPKGVFKKGLNWGKRELTPTRYDGIKYGTFDGFADQILTDIRRGAIVNLVAGDMEFGPRALCNTSTLALPYSENIDAINKANGRNTVMPMAPVMLEANARLFFNKWDLDRTIGSDKYMITAHDWVYSKPPEILEGVSHKDRDKSYSGRPQILSDASEAPIANHILQNIQSPALVNTSLNTHGVPIIFDTHDFVQLAKTWKTTCPAEHVNYVLRND